MAKKSRRATSTNETATSRKPGGKGAWRLMDRGASLVAGMLAQRVSAVTWRAATGKRPPASGRHPEVSTGEAVAWAVVGGALIELVKVFVRRWTATYWVKSTGSLPPGMKPLATTPGHHKEPAPTEPAPTRTTRFSRRSRGR